MTKYIYIYTSSLHLVRMDRWINVNAEFGGNNCNKIRFCWGKIGFKNRYKPKLRIGKRKTVTAPNSRIASLKVHLLMIVQ